MCFSAQASFLTTGALVIIGALCLTKIKKPAHALLAVIPFFFAIQQTAEGILWLRIPLGGPPGLITFATTVFLTFAFMVYPLWLPLSVFIMEKDEGRRRMISWCGAIGILWAATAAYHIFLVGAHPLIKGCHIYYSFEQSFVPLDFAIVLYSIATILPFFIARWWVLKTFGLLLALSLIISYLVWHTYFVSVWCFFVALISLGVYGILVADRSDLPQAPMEK